MGPAGLHARASPDERRPHRRRHRRAQDRAAAAGAVGRRRATARACRSRRSATSRAERAARRPRDGGLRRRRRVRHHRALGQELPQDASGCCSSAAAVRAVRRRALRRHARRRRKRSRWASITSRSPSGAGRPTVLDLPNGLARGVRTASDFLMALQLTGAAKTDSIANMQVRLPVVVDRRRPDGDRHRDRVARVLPGAGREVPAALRGARARHGEAAARIAWTDEERVDRRRVPRARARDSRRARAGRREGGARPASSSCLQSWGGVDDRLPPAADRQPVLHAQSRGSGEGAGGGHRVRRGTDAARASKSTRTATPARCACRVQRIDGDGEWHEAAQAELPARTILDRGRNAAQHRARARGRSALSARRQVFPGAATRTGEPVTARQALSPSPQHAARAADASCAPTGAAMSYLRRRAPVVLRQRRQGDGQREAGLSRSSRACWRKVAPASDASRRGVPRAAQRRAARDGARASSA